MKLSLQKFERYVPRKWGSKTPHCSKYRLEQVGHARFTILVWTKINQVLYEHPTAGDGSEIVHVFVMLVLICWLHWPPREGEYVSVREHKKEANRIMYKSRPTEVEYTTMRRMCPEF